MCRPAESNAAATGAQSVPAMTADSWRTAEAGLFEPLLNRPDLYERVIGLVGITVDRLRRLGPTTSRLLDAAPTIGALVREVGEARGFATDGIDPEQVGRAALALRHREIVAQQACAQRVRQLCDARAGNLAWAVLEETGDPAGDPALPYRRLEVATATGHAIVVTAVPADDFRSCLHAAQACHVDLDTGRIGVPPGAEEQRVQARNAAEREANVATMREALTRPR
jgi:hypothetical protein